MTPITFRATAARFARADDRRICELAPSEIAGMGGSEYALLDGNTICDAGDLNRVTDWAREAGVLAVSETVTA